MNLAYVSKFIQPDLVLDIGAGTGGWFKEAKEIWPDAQFWLCEANDECSEALEALNVDFNISVLSDKVKTVTFYKRKDSPAATGNSYYLENTVFYEGDKAIPTEVQTDTLDNVCADLYFEHKRVLLKLDTQGSECDILKGGKKTLKHCQGLIVEVGYTNYNQGAPTASVVDQWIKEHGFANYGAIEDLVHPIERGLIQQSILYLR